MAPLLAILGPTGSGKSQLAVALAQRFRGEVVNYDSIQVYRHFHIGAAKLALDQRQGVPHHLIDILEPTQVFTAGEFARQAGALVGAIRDRGRLPILAGGTGFYLRALLEGLFPGPMRDDRLRQRLERMKSENRPRLLKRLDPAAAARIHPNDSPKIIRAIEVTILGRRPMTQQFADGRQGLEGFRVLKIGLDPDRQALHEHINRRTEAMFAAGLVEEVRQILTLGYPETAKPFESHGYRQTLEHLRGRLSLEEAVAEAQRNTRQYAKRQMTWFRKEKDVDWFHGFGGDQEVQQAVAARVTRYGCAT